MIRTILLLLLLLPIGLCGQNPDKEILNIIQQNQILSFGGCDLIQVKSKTYLAGVSAVEVGTKKISSLIRVGKVKAEREIATFINGSDITSRTESYIKEEVITVNDSSSVTTIDTFVEYIREDSEGFVKSMRPAGFWYSEDKTLFFYALYKEVNL
nr:hypothetical protein [Bacteroidota bacterium]